MKKGDRSEQDKIDYILEDLRKEYNPLVMQIYGDCESLTLYDIEVLLYD